MNDNPLMRYLVGAGCVLLLGATALRAVAGDLVEMESLDLEEIKPLVRDPKFICESCGRVANSDTNLCQPVPID